MRWTSPFSIYKFSRHCHKTGTVVLSVRKHHDMIGPDFFLPASSVLYTCGLFQRFLYLSLISSHSIQEAYASILYVWLISAFIYTCPISPCLYICGFFSIWYISSLFGHVMYFSHSFYIFSAYFNMLHICGLFQHDIYL